MTEESRKETDHQETLDHFNALSTSRFADIIHAEIEQVKSICPGSHFTIHTSSSLMDGQIDSCVNLVRNNLGHLYRASAWGWSNATKYEEMKDPNQRFIIISSHPDQSLPGQDLGSRQETIQYQESECEQVQGFLSFQVVDESGPCIYCYELQLLPSLRSRGIGRLLMHMMEKIGAASRIDKSMLTVFTANEAAMTFYERMGYKVDASSPQRVVLRKTRSGTRRIVSDYLILSKDIPCRT